MRDRLRALIRWLEPRGLREDELEPARLMLRAWLWAIPALLLVLTMYLVNGMRAQRVVQVLTIAAGLAILAAFRLGWPMRWAREASLAVMVVSFVASALVQTPFDPSSVFFLSIIPLVAGFVAGFR